MNIAVCDGEAETRYFIKKLIEKQDADCRIVEFSSGGDFLRFWEQEGGEQIDILFLDISVEGTDGMEVAEQIKKWREERDEALWGSLPLLIFISGYPEYMPKAFSVNAFQYLVKPVSEEKFTEVFAQAVHVCRCLKAKKNIEPKKILIRDGKDIRNIPVDDIYYIESSNRKIIVFMREGKAECYGKIGEFEDQLKEGFFRIHRGYLVNMKYVERYSRTGVEMKDGSCLIISKYKYQDFIKAYRGYISENDG